MHGTPPTKGANEDGKGRTDEAYDRYYDVLPSPIVLNFFLAAKVGEKKTDDAIDKIVHDDSASIKKIKIWDAKPAMSP